MIPTNWIKGNHITAFFLKQVDHTPNGEVIIKKIYKCASLRGNNLAVFWIDLCNREMTSAMKLCKHCPCDILEDACSRNDGSGKKLIEKYLTDEYI